MNEKTLEFLNKITLLKYASNARPKKEAKNILYKLIYLHARYLVFVCLNLIVFYIASVNKIMNNLYGFLLMS